MKTCEECSHKCKAQCCNFVPLPIWFINKYKDKIQRKIIQLTPVTSSNPKVVYCIVEIDGFKDGKPIIDRSKQKCIFLNKENRCVVYDDRLEICKIYGTTTEPDNSLTCGFHIGKDYSYPKEGTPEFNAIKLADEQGKYIDQVLHNQKYMEEMFF